MCAKPITRRCVCQMQHPLNNLQALLAQSRPVDYITEANNLQNITTVTLWLGSNVIATLCHNIGAFCGQGCILIAARQLLLWLCCKCFAFHSWPSYLE